MSNLYEIGNVLKSSLRTKEYPLFVMVCNDGHGSIDQTETQFRAIVLFNSESELDPPGTQSNNWNKNRWVISSLAEVGEAQGS